MNLLSPLPDAGAAERVDALLTKPGLRIERIVSQGQASPRGFWYDQAEAEWVLVLTGSARLRFVDETETRFSGPAIGSISLRIAATGWSGPTLPSRPCGWRYFTGSAASSAPTGTDSRPQRLRQAVSPCVKKKAAPLAPP